MKIKVVSTDLEFSFRCPDNWQANDAMNGSCTSAATQYAVRTLTRQAGEPPQLSYSVSFLFTPSPTRLLDYSILHIAVIVTLMQISIRSEIRSLLHDALFGTTYVVINCSHIKNFDSNHHITI